MKKITIVLGSIVVIAIVLFVLSKTGVINTHKVTAPITDPITDIKDKTTNPYGTNCAFKVDSPQANSLVTFPLNISVTIDHSNPNCHWTVFEAQAGNVKVVDENAVVYGQMPITTTGDWMSSGPVVYTALLTLTSMPPTNNLSLVFTEENPSGEGTSQTVTIPVIKQ